MFELKLSVTYSYSHDIMNDISKFKNISESFVNYYETIHNNHILILYPTLEHFIEKYFKL